MAHVLVVSALKFGHPVGVLVLMEANDLLFHGLTAPSGGLFARLLVTRFLGGGFTVEHRLCA